MKKLEISQKTSNKCSQHRSHKSSIILTLLNSPTQKDSPKYLEPTTVVPSNRRAPQFDGVQSTEIGGIWPMKYNISSPKLY